MKPDDRVRDYWDKIRAEASEGAPLNRHEESESRPATRDDLADRLMAYNEERASLALHQRVRIIGWIFLAAFVLLFVACVYAGLNAS